VAKYFYSNCVITGIGKPQTPFQTNTVTASAKINGRSAPKVMFSSEMYNYFQGAGNGKEHRVWFVVAKKKDPIMIISVQNEAGEIHKPKSQARDGLGVLLGSILNASIAWAATYFFLPALVGHRNQDSASFWIWVITAVFFIFRGGKALAKLSTPENWQQGNIDNFTQEVEPLFSSPKRNSPDNWMNS